MLFPFYNDFRPDPSEVVPSEDRVVLSQIETCRERRGLTGCSPCPYFDDCNLLKGYLLKRAFGNGSADGSTP